MKQVLIIWILFLQMTNSLVGQNRLFVDTGGFEIPRFIDKQKNVLQGNIKSLNSFYEMLYRLRKYGELEERKVRIVHIGDSHLQAGFLNGTVMRRFHADFGNAGRGLVVPLKLSNTNEPIDYDIVSDIRWNSARCLSRNPRYPVGIGGIAIVPNDSLFYLEVQIPENEARQYRFNQVDVYHHAGAAILQPMEKGIKQKSSSWPFVTRFVLDHSVTKLRFAGQINHKDSSVYYGFSLENGRNGVLYHTIGINGAQFVHYKNVDRFTEQVHSLLPDVVIFSLGTNEAFQGSFSESRIRREMDEVVLTVKAANPNAVIILTTPPECQWKEKKGNEYNPNPYIQPIAATICRYAEEHGFVYWDLFGMSGGSGSSEEWISENFLARDRIHFAISGYRLQGNLLYDAFMKEYNRYVKLVREPLKSQELEWHKLLFPMWGWSMVPLKSVKLFY